MKIDFDGRTWQLDLDDIDLKQGIQVQAHTGLTLRKWEAALTDDDNPRFLESYQALYWVMLAQNGEPQPPEIGEVNFKVIRFFEAVITAFEAAIKDAAASAGDEKPDPTLPPAASAPSPEPSSPGGSLAVAAESPDG
jgi:hypothetical protein